MKKGRSDMSDAKSFLPLVGSAVLPAGQANAGQDQDAEAALEEGFRAPLGDVESRLLEEMPKVDDDNTYRGTNEADQYYKLHRRFDRLGRLFGDDAFSRLMNLRVVVFGVGGVGSYAAEALARSAVGHIMLVDFDDVCVTNTNRQLQSLKGNIGQPKAQVLRDRLRLINPEAQVESQRIFYNAERSKELLTSPWRDGGYDYVIDCIDNVTAKLHLIATCRERGQRVITSMGAAGKMDPTQIRVSDLHNTQHCMLARRVRKHLRQQYDFPRDGEMGVTAVYSTEARQWPRALSYDKGEGFRCVCPNRSPEHGCDNRNLIDGTAVYVTGSFGFACASAVVNDATAEFREQTPRGMSRNEQDAL